jgi:cytochrome d ubiquinol oxidase subunit II
MWPGAKTQRWSTSETPTFRLAVLLFLLGFSGLATSLWPYLAPWTVTIWSGAADPQTLRFAGVGVSVILPIVLAYQIHAYWVFRSKTVSESGVEVREPGIQARRTSSKSKDLHLS